MQNKTSGIPRGLIGIGPAKLETFSLEQVLLALTENGMSGPSTDMEEGAKERWAKDALLSRWFFALPKNQACVLECS